MSYKISKSDSVGEGLKRAAAGHIRRARNTLSRNGSVRGVAGGNAAAAVHEARTRFKKVRGLLRLARCGLGRSVFRRENLFFRDAGRNIRAVRDGMALIEALDTLSSRCFKEKPPVIVGKLRRLLVRDAQRLARTLKSDGGITRTARDLDEELKRVKAWQLDGFTWRDARRAWRRECKTCLQAFETASKEPTDENLHEWRKRAKNLWHETLLLCKASPKLQERMRDVETLTKILGEDHDLALLGKAAVRRRVSLGSPDQVKMLLALLAARRRRLQADAFALAAKIKAVASREKKG